MARSKLPVLLPAAKHDVKKAYEWYEEQKSNILLFVLDSLGTRIVDLTDLEAYSLGNSVEESQAGEEPLGSTSTGTAAVVVGSFQEFVKLSLPRDGICIQSRIDSEQNRVFWQRCFARLIVKPLKHRSIAATYFK